MRRLFLVLASFALIFAGAELMRHWGRSLRNVTRAPVFEKIFRPPTIRSVVKGYPRSRNVVIVVVEGLDGADFDSLAPVIARRGKAYGGRLRAPADDPSALDVLLTGIAFWDVLPRPLAAYRDRRPDHLVEVMRRVERGGVFLVGGSALRHYATYPLRREEYNPQKGTLKEDAGMIRRFLADLQSPLGCSRSLRILGLTGLDDWKRAHPGQGLDGSGWRPVLERGVESLFQILRNPMDTVILVGLPLPDGPNARERSCPFAVYGESVKERADARGELGRLTSTVALLLGLRCPALATEAPFTDMHQAFRVRTRILVMERLLAEGTRVLQYVAREAAGVTFPGEERLFEEAVAAAEDRRFVDAVALLEKAAEKVHARFREIVPRAFRREWGERLLPAYLFGIVGLFGVITGLAACRRRILLVVVCLLMGAFLATALGHVHLEEGGWSLATLEAGDVLPPWPLAAAAFAAYVVAALAMAWTDDYELENFLGVYAVTAGGLFLPLGWFYLEDGPLFILVRGAVRGSIPGPLALAQVALVLAPALVAAGLLVWPVSRLRRRGRRRSGGHAGGHSGAHSAAHAGAHAAAPSEAPSETHGVAQQGLVLPEGRHVQTPGELSVGRPVETPGE